VNELGWNECGGGGGHKEELSWMTTASARLREADFNEAPGAFGNRAHFVNDLFRKMS
jgi:hypothetical protein